MKKCLVQISLLSLITSIGHSLSSVHSTKFKLDGDTESDTPHHNGGFPIDWDYFLPSNNIGNSVGYFATGILNDNSMTPITTYEGSAKDTKDISAWLWGPDNNYQAKTDIYHIMAYAQPVNNDDELIIYFGADRLGGEPANAAFGFWFIQDPSFGLTGTTSGSFSGTHFPNDLLITANFANPPFIEVYRWEGAGTSGHLTAVGSQSALCDSTKSQLICAIYNQVLSYTSLGFPASNSNPLNNYAPNTFMEGGVNVGAFLSSIDGSIPCFSKFLSMTRSSTSTTSTLKDFAIGDFDMCETTATIQCDESNVVVDQDENGDNIYTFFYSITIDQVGIGNIYDVSIIIPNGFNEGQTQTDNIGVINANTQQTFQFFFTSTLNHVEIPDVIIKYCFFDNCSTQFQRTITAENILCESPTPSPTPSPTRVPSSVPTHVPTPVPTSAPTHVPSSVPTKVPTPVPTSVPTYTPSSNPTASPVTPNIDIEGSCEITINNDYCLEFDYFWEVCNLGDRIISNIEVTSEKDENYLFTMPSLDVGACINSSVIFEPIRNSNNDPILTNYIWQDSIHVVGNMIVGGIKTITLQDSFHFQCPICPSS